MSYVHIVHAVAIAMTLISYLVFAPAVVHARDNVDRLYLLGGVIVLAGVAYGSAVHFQLPVTLATYLFIVGQLVWAASAWKSRARRRARMRSNGGSSE